ncbi:MAG: sugar transferase [Nitrospirae bacterium]|nr:MAG: sugar transferase [Nitrospirota bacterium]
MIKRRSSYFLGGYSKAYILLNTVFNFSFALFFLVLASPLFLALAIVIKLQDRGPVFYKGVRLGRNKKPYMMYKFRTLVPDAEQKIGAELLSPKHRLETKLGKLLRDTRLDELPQLFNILKGDMDFVGPRPERPIIYETVCRHIKNYDRRFTIKPGLIGFSQLFTPHSTPKEIRTLIDNRLIQLKQNFLFDIGIMLYTMMTIATKAVSKISRYIWHKFIKGTILGIKEKRNQERVQQRHAKVSIGSKIDGTETYFDEAVIVDINDEAFLIKSGHTLPKDKLFFKLETQYKGPLAKKEKKKAAFCFGEIYKEIESPSEGNSQPEISYVIKYKAVSPLNFYMLHQYFLHGSIA